MMEIENQNFSCWFLIGMYLSLTFVWTCFATDRQINLYPHKSSYKRLIIVFLLNLVGCPICCFIVLIKMILRKEI